MENGLIFGIVGNIGNGKTLLATYFAALWNAYKKRVYSNYNISLSLAKKITAQDFVDLNKLKDSLAILDEAYTWLESRMSGSDLNRILSHGVLQSRKKGVDLIYTAQLNSTVDLRLRRITSTMIWALSPTEAGFNYAFFTPTSTVYRTLDISLCQKIFKIYDTKEIVGQAAVDGEDENDDQVSRKRSESMGQMSSLKTMTLLKQVLIEQKSTVTKLKEMYAENQYLSKRIEILEKRLKVRNI